MPGSREVGRGDEVPGGGEEEEEVAPAVKVPEVEDPDKVKPTLFIGLLITSLLGLG